MRRPCLSTTASSTCNDGRVKESTKDVLKFLLGFIVVVLAFGGYKLLAVLERT
jgi:hypothetical protein